MENKIFRSTELLEAVYGRQLRYSSKQPLAQLISSVLSQRTTYTDERAAFEAMWKRFGSWNAIMEAPTQELTEAISRASYPEVKAPRIQQILQKIYQELGHWDIRFLQDKTVEEASDWLQKLPGVGHKTSTFLLLFVFKLPALPVDTHVHRVSQRLGLIDTKVSEAKAHRLLKEMLPQKADDLLNFHKLFFKHGQRVCTWRSPKCSSCILSEICQSYQEKRDLFAKYQATIG